MFDYVKKVPLLRHDIEKPYEGDNIRVKVLLVNNGDMMPMLSVFTKSDLFNLAVGRDMRSIRWRADVKPFDQPLEYFYGVGTDGEDVRAMVSRMRKALGTVEGEEF